MINGRTVSWVGLCGLLLSCAAWAQDRTDGPDIDANGVDRRCRVECEAKGKRLFAECRRDGGGRRECLDRARDAVEECLSDCHRPIDCEHMCRFRAEHIKEACLRLGGSDETCDAMAERAQVRCVAAACRQPPDCEDRCITAAIAASEECDGTQQDCGRLARGLLTECLDENCSAPPDCEQRCTLLGNRAFEACTDLGGGADECAELARRVTARCLEQRCEQPPNCVEECIERAKDFYFQCLEENADLDGCAARAREMLVRCVDAHCEQPPDCEQRCVNRSERIYRACIEMGGAEAACAERAREALDKCLQADCRQPPDCSDACLERAKRLFRECMESTTDADPSVCAAEARRFFTACVEEHCPDRDCAGQCFSRTKDAYFACREHGGSQRDCANRARHLLDLCLEFHCGPKCGGILGMECPAGAFCQRPPGMCDGADLEGVCTPIPDACPENDDPVCGCDGVTYTNRCFAAAAGGSIDHPGECEQPCSRTGGELCPSGQFCKIPAGNCDRDVPGVCRPIPQGCPDVWAPVCGCDGNTYSNECDADVAGVPIAHRGECRRDCGRPDSEPCEDDEFCRFHPGDCDGVDGGVCEPRPPFCPLVWMPVCGCDGNTYGNRCEAASAGVSIAYEGRCENICRGIQGIACPADQFCKLPPGHCCCDFVGACTDVPRQCPDHIDPVCGCDGETYANPCEADMAGVSVDHPGPCERRCGIDPAIGEAACEKGWFCLFPHGTCGDTDAGGVCEPIPLACTREFAPVCGCDGETYSNRCGAHSQGVSVRHEGPCEILCGPDVACSAGWFCMQPPGLCRDAGEGLCIPMPDACPEVFDPVCGCDGETYPNRCFAASRGVSIRHEGECRR